MSTDHRRAWLASLLAPMAVSGALVAAASTVDPQMPAPRTVQPAPRVQSVSCPFLGAGGVLTVAGDRVSAVDTSGAPVSASGPVHRPLLLRQTGGTSQMGGGVLATAAEGAAWTECGAPSTSGAIALPDPGGADLALFNSDREPAVVTIALSGADGPITSAGLRDIAVPANTLVRVPLSVHAPEGSPVTASYTTSRGRVVAVADLTLGGDDQATATVPTSSLQFPSVPAGASRVRLVLGNPGEERAQLQISVLGPRGRFTPETGVTSVEPHSTIQLDLTTPLGGQGVGIQVESSVAVTGVVQVDLGKDAAWLTPASTARRLHDVVPQGTLQVVNPGAAEATITITTQQGSPRQVSVAAGGVTTMTVPAGAVSVDASSPVAAGVVTARGGVTTARLRPVPAEVRPGAGVLDPLIGQG